MIRNLIFDVGDVLVEYRWFEMLTRDYGLSEAEAKRIGEEMFDNEIWVQGLDGGRLSLEEAIHQYELKYPDDVDVMGWFLRNGEQMAVKRPEVWDKVAALKEKGYKIYLLSNYSEELLHVHTKGAKFLNVLDGGVVSYQVHALKPDRKIYEKRVYQSPFAHVRRRRSRRRGRRSRRSSQHAGIWCGANRSVR